MRKMLRYGFATVIVALLTAIPVFALVEPTKDFYVNDYADVLSEETEKYIQEHSVALANATTAQIVVVTVKNLEGESLEEYATALFRKFGIGDKEKNNGLLLLLALEERQSRIEVGYGLEGLLPDAKTGRFQDKYMIPYYKENDFDQGMLNGYKAFYQEVAASYDFDTDVNPTEVASVSDGEDDDSYMTVASVLGFFGYFAVGIAYAAAAMIIFNTAVQGLFSVLIRLGEFEEAAGSISLPVTREV